MVMTFASSYSSSVRAIGGEGEFLSGTSFEFQHAVFTVEDRIYYTSVPFGVQSSCGIDGELGAVLVGLQRLRGPADQE
jgi:hypothetical protein